MNAVPPLVVTLTLDTAAQRRFDELRRRFFPPERLHVGAHVTLFHALPGEQEAAVARALADVAESTRPFSLAVLNIRLLGRGVAYGLTAAEAAPLRRRLAACFEGWLTAQDRGGWWSHVTVQNKVAPDLARDTQARLRGEPVPSPITATGLALWRYRGGPWEAITRYPFSPVT